MKLLVISHTAHYLDASGQIVGWEPTVRELNHLTDIFEEIWHLAVLHPEAAPGSAVPYQSKAIHFIPIQPTGGTSIKDKFGILLQTPSVIYQAKQLLSKVDYFQFRAPTGIGVYLIPWLTWFTTKKGWFKYAGNWSEPHAPWSFRFQRWFLLNNQQRKVTMNGKWEDQKSHCISFENPCITAIELENAVRVGKGKNFEQKYTLAFVGNLSPNKGIIELLEALPLLKHKNCIDKLIIAGDGPIRAKVEALAAQAGIKTELVGFVNRIQLNTIYTQSHFICLPSHSEGFPKVIAEGAAFGCIPVVSDVSAIGQYVLHGENGFLIKQVNADTIATVLDEALKQTNTLQQFSVNAMEMASLFTYERYRQRIVTDILSTSLV